MRLEDLQLDVSWQASGEHSWMTVPVPNTATPVQMTFLLGPSHRELAFSKSLFPTYQQITTEHTVDPLPQTCTAGSEKGQSILQVSMQVLGRGGLIQWMTREE